MFVLLVALNVVYTAPAPHECRAERNGRPAKARCICGSALWREWWCGVGGLVGRAGCSVAA